MALAGTPDSIVKLGFGGPASGIVTLGFASGDPTPTEDVTYTGYASVIRPRNGVDPRKSTIRGRASIVTVPVTP